MAEHHHAVRFYQDSESLCRIVGEFVGKGLEGGDPAVIIAIPTIECASTHAFANVA